MEKESKVISLSKRILIQLKPLSKKIMIAGSIRRGERNPRDIDIVLIPKNKNKIREILSRRGKFLQGGNKKAYFMIQGVKVEIYYTNIQEWGATLLAYSSPKGSEIGLRIVAREKGFKLNQHGLFSRKTGKRIAGKTEREIYSTLGRPYKKPENR